MRKTEIVAAIAKTTACAKKDVVKIVDAYLAALKAELRAEKRFSIVNFGTFIVTKSKPLVVYSPYDGRTIKKDAQFRVHFKTAAAFKKSLNAK